MKKFIKRLFISFLALILLLTIAVVAAPTLFKDKLIALAKKELNARVAGNVDFDNINVSWWNSFPDVSLEIEELKIEGIKQDSSQSDLLFTKSLGFSFDFMSVWSQGDSLEIKSMSIDEPKVNIYVNSKGETNYDLFSNTDTTSTSTEGGGIKFNLSDYSIRDGEINYIDQSSKTVFATEKLNHGGNLEYDNDILLLNTFLNSNSLSVIQDGLTYLDKTRVDFEGGLQFDLKQGIYSFLENDLIINALHLFLQGQVQMTDDKITTDLTLNTRKNTFKSFLSILPNMYAGQFADVQTKGNLELSASLKGTYDGANNEWPVYDVHMKVDDGWFQMPDKSMAIDDINITADIRNTSKTITPVLIDIPIFNFLLNEEHMQGRAKINQSGNNQFFDAQLKGKVDLAALQKAYPLPDIKDMSGMLDVDMAMKGNTLAVEKGNYDELQSSGHIITSNVKVQQRTGPEFNLASGRADVMDDKLVLSDLNLTYGKSDMKSTAEIYPLSSLLVNGGPPITLSGNMQGKALYASDFLNATEEETDENTPNTCSGLPDIVYNLSGKYDYVSYEEYELKNSSFDLSGNLNTLNINSFKSNVYGDEINAKGQISNIENYLYANETLKGEINVQSPSFNSNHWMTEESESSTSTTDEAEYVAVPDHMDLRIKMNVNELIYDDLSIKNYSGNVAIKNQKLIFQDVKGNVMNGAFTLDGFYGYDGFSKPQFKLAYNIDQFSFEKTFEQIESAQFLMPIIRYIKGSFNNDMVIEGRLKPGYFPDLTALSGEGVLETLHAQIVNSKALDKMASLVGVDDLKALNLDRSKNRFSIDNGQMNVAPIEQDFKGMLAKFSGSHKLTGDMDYVLKLNIPTEKFNKQVPKSLKSQFASVQKDLNKLGITWEETKSIEVIFLLTGALTDPDIKMQLVDFSKATVKEAVKEAAKQVVETAKDSANREAIKFIQGDKQDSTQTSIAEAAKDRAKEEAENKIKEEAKPVVDTLKNQVKDEVNQVLDDVLNEEDKNKVNNILDGWNPFKKKKDED